MVTIPIKVKNTLFDTCFNKSRNSSDIIDVSAKHRSDTDFNSKVRFVILAPLGRESCSIIWPIISDSVDEFWSGSKDISSA